MVYQIRPHADHLNRMIDLEYQQAPTARSWMDYTRKQEPVAQESAPVLILSERPTPLPDAFEISRDYWCVSARVRDLMQRLFGPQVAFYEVPVTAEEGNASLPSTNFVAFSKFCDLIDWQKSKVQVRTYTGLPPDAEVIALADTPAAAVFKPMPSDRQMIWIERTIRNGNRLFSPGSKVYATDVAAQAIGEAFPGAFLLRKQRADPSATAAPKD
jgi:uncharacterized protein DUF1629